ncbi:MAG TPA: hypothetical protein VFN10_16365 [Thermoanaerobaculia bacterium]|nr:hypothetical protein [Thermoanaerobaculia bacterium]
MTETTEDILRSLTHEDAVTYVGTVFQAAVGDSTAELKLVAADRIMPNRPRSTRMKRDPFSLIFHGPAVPRLYQGMFQLQSDVVSFPNIFLVPVGQLEEGGFEYEAVFT